jgi:adenylylsulfate kinase
MGQTVSNEVMTTGAVIWLTGFSGAGKSTVARALVSELERRGPSELLDGDALRAIAPIGFSREEREAHVVRVGYLASRLEHHGVTVVAALISPYRASRARVRSLCANFIEVHISTSLEVCEARDVKGLYKKARRGEVAHFTGISDPYEPPEAPELSIDTSALPPEESTRRILGVLEQKVRHVRA